MKEEYCKIKEINCMNCTTVTVSQGDVTVEPQQQSNGRNYTEGRDNIERSGKYHHVI